MHFIDVIDPATLGMFARLSVAMMCGLLLGAERAISGKSAGMRTYALVTIGASLFVIIAELVVDRYAVGTFNPLTIMSGIISGIGFMGAGVIIFRDSNVTGLTTASGLWVAAGIGVASGFGLYTLALVTTVLALFVFVILYRVERRIKRLSAAKETTGE